jgi:hypothetical protein
VKHVERGYITVLKNTMGATVAGFRLLALVHVVPVFPGIEILLSLKEPSEMRERDSRRDFSVKQEE